MMRIAALCTPVALTVACGAPAMNGADGALADSNLPSDASVARDVPLGRDVAAPDVATDASPPLFTSMAVTFYGWPDNSPPGADIAYPNALHARAGGTGTYDDPITFATDPSEFAAGTRLYVPFIAKYVVMEDTCGQCATDWMSHAFHIDVWMNSEATHTNELLACEGQWTQTATAVEIDPPRGRTVTTAPLFDPGTGTCRASP